MSECDPTLPDQAFSTVQAGKYIGLSPRALSDRPDIERFDISKPGSQKPVWRYRRSTLDRVITARTERGTPTPESSAQ